MKILLVNSPVDENKPTRLQEPLAVAYLASVLIENGHNVRIKDFDAEKFDESSFIRYINRFSPDLFGVSCFTSSFPFAKKIMDIAKGWNSGLPVAVGGIHASIESSKSVFNSTKADFIVQGEGEDTVIELVNAIESGKKSLRTIRGISYKNGDRIINNKLRELISDLDKIPFPARQLLPMNLYQSAENLFDLPFHEIGNEQLLGNVLSSRGCPFNCIYCCSVINRRKIRLRSADNVYQELEILVNDYKRDGLYFVDDQFTFDKKRLEELFYLIRKNKLDINWRCQSRVDNIDADILKKMKESGCTSITYGIETGDNETLRRINKGTTLERGRKSARLTKRLGIHSRCNFMLGFPWDTHNSIKRTIKFAADIDPNSAAFYLTTPYPGTELWDYAIEQNIVEKDMDWKSFTNKEPKFRTKNVTHSTLEDYLKFAQIYVYTKNLKKELFSPECWKNFISDFIRTKDVKRSIRYNFRRLVNLIGQLKIDMNNKPIKARVSYLLRMLGYHLKVSL